ncbi:O-acetyltransferase OatA [BD1-7 clade bacterium]|uniref:O-acetyltransferase OatA n=1 Tax=BD1-7 clade bacterium TaxID=2029982 RepID=A0A5S9QF29_9GAMM|nr:O-acetyltransferase OatA [BD1-7 clade bacterium]CAA0117089.1 O-acetyltransferase OatA [BD1-7 clade bacterium]
MIERLIFILSCFNPLDNGKRIFNRTGNRFAPVDGIRALSMFYVVVTHAMVVLMISQQAMVREFITSQTWYSQWILMGDKGVDAFFVISGFLIGRLLMEEHQRSSTLNYKRFYYRRWLRLTPVYALFLIVWAQFAAPGVDKNYLWAYLFYVNNFLDEAHRYIPWLWSLAVEEQFYLVFPALLSLFFFRSRRPWLFWAGLFVISLVIRWVILLQQPDLLVSGADLLVGKGDLNARYNQALYINLYTRFGPLVVGGFLAYVWVYRPDWLARLASTRAQLMLWGCLLVVAGFFAFSPVYSDQEQPIWFFYLFHIGHRHLFAVMVALLMVLALQPQGVGRYLASILGSRVWFPFAQLSYSMYIFHLPIIYLTYELMKNSGWALSLSVPNVFVLTGLSLIPLTLVSAFLYTFVESPFIKLREYKRKSIGKNDALCR